MFTMGAIVYREDDGRWTAEIPSCPGCAAAGDTRAEAIENLREAAELYFEDDGEMSLAIGHQHELERVSL